MWYNRITDVCSIVLVYLLSGGGGGGGSHMRKEDPLGDRDPGTHAGHMQQ